MAELQFNEEPQEFSRYDAATRPSALARLVLATGVVETQEAAQYVLFGLFILFTAATLWIFFAPERGISQTASPIVNLKAIKEMSAQQPYY